jgi:hypothetical protein
VCINPSVFGKQINFAIVSHYIGDPSYAGRDGQSLAFEYAGEFLRASDHDANKALLTNESQEPGFTVQVTAHDWTPQSKNYTARVATKAFTSDWRRVTLSASRFAAADGKVLTGWRDLDKIEIRGIGSKRSTPRFARFKWTAQ